MTGAAANRAGVVLAAPGLTGVSANRAGDAPARSRPIPPTAFGFQPPAGARRSPLGWVKTQGCRYGLSDR
jgi:hypothetical protein